MAGNIGGDRFQSYMRCCLITLSRHCVLLRTRDALMLVNDDQWSSAVHPEVHFRSF